MSEEMIELYNRLKTARNTPNFYFTLSSGELYILVEFLSKIAEKRANKKGQ